MQNLGLRALLLGAAIGLAASAASATGYQLTKIQIPGAWTVSADDVNNRGQVVGSYSMDPSDLSASSAYLYQAGVLTTLTGPAGSVYVTASGIADTGTVVGTFSTTSWVDGDGNRQYGPSQGFILDGGQYRVVALGGAEQVLLQGISPGGRYVTGNAVQANGSYLGFVMDLSNNQTTYIGRAEPGALTLVKGVTDAGLVLGDTRGRNADGSTWFSGLQFDLASGQTRLDNIAGYRRTAIRETNATGTLVGFYGNPGIYHGFVGSTADYQSLDYGSSYTLLRGINDAGWLTGTAVDVDGSGYGLLLTPVPEPASALLGLAGLAVLGVRMRRRR